MAEVTNEDRKAATVWAAVFFRDESEALIARTGFECAHAIQRARAEKAETKTDECQAERDAERERAEAAERELAIVRGRRKKRIADMQTRAEQFCMPQRPGMMTISEAMAFAVLEVETAETERDEARENYETAHRAHADAVHDKHVALRECEQAEMACAKAERERGVAEKFAENMEKLHGEARARVAELEGQLQTAKQRIQQLDTPNHLKWNEGYDDGDG